MAFWRFFGAGTSLGGSAVQTQPLRSHFLFLMERWLALPVA
ncbi:hypothetical protein RBSWK_02829 [Rhodopirellula baltica SWK14]|uniref:Uncharacterized protein n=1 Tax=Rhodopirellula baltica SWK14 TaxID=993516 RepID=L7CGU5_RHOBT|nr:hypothetical protein RBSWK_02829 [Rhodopirellula baltica SWK14]